MTKKNKRVLGIDYGDRRVGVAISDELQLTAQPLALINRQNDTDLISEIKEITVAHDVEKIIVGFPVSLDGTYSSQTKKTQKFISRMRKSSDLLIEKWEERLSTLEAGKILTGVSKNKKKESIDIISAQLILQGYLDKNRKN
ncbi:MAG: Holliday junction resolvase RuvX [Nitrospinota bacterium]|nr:Holliday junction resolvase RuvX [Nitrospinota bacterium]